MIEVFRISISKEEFRAIPPEERNLFLLAGHALNQMSVLQRLLIFSLNHQPNNSIEQKLSAAQTQMILRLLLGVLAETWELIRRYHKIIGTNYMKAIEPSGIAAYQQLKKHFGSSGLLHKIRNTIAFHYPCNSELDAAFEELPSDEDWAFYPARSTSNSYYLASELVIMSGLLRATGEQDTEKAFNRVMNLVTPTINGFADFLQLLMRAIAIRHLGAKALSFADGTGTKIKNAPSIWEFSIPFFTDPNQLHPS